MTTPAVSLAVPDLALLDAAVAGGAALGRALGCSVADGWEVFPTAVRRTRDAVAEDPSRIRWGTRLILVDEPRTLVGWGGYKGPPRDGAIEVGYAIAPAWRGRGLATAAVRELVREGFEDPGVSAILAHTRPEPGPSSRVLEKCGFVNEGEVPDQGIGTAWRFRLARA